MHYFMYKFKDEHLELVHIYTERTPQGGTYNGVSHGQPRTVIVPKPVSPVSPTAWESRPGDDQAALPGRFTDCSIITDSIL